MASNLLTWLAAAQAASGSGVSAATGKTYYSWGALPLQLPRSDNESVPAAAITSGSFTAVSANVSHAVAIKSDGTLWAWGVNSSGQLGDGSTVNKSSPVQIGAGSWAAVSANNITGGLL